MALAILAGALTGCAPAQPDYGEPSPDCGWAPEMELGWAGQGDPAEFDLAERGDSLRSGAIYVEAEPTLPRQDQRIPPERQVCVIVGGGQSYAFSVPDGWVPAEGP